MIGGVGRVASAEGEEARFIRVFTAVAIRHLAQVLRTKHRDVWGRGGSISMVLVYLVYNSLPRILFVRLCGVNILAPLPVFGY